MYGFILENYDLRIMWGYRVVTILLLSERVISKVSKLSDSNRKFCFVIDDSMLERAKGKEVELMSRQYDHVSKTFVKGFNLLQVGWTNGVSFFLG